MTYSDISVIRLRIDMPYSAIRLSSPPLLNIVAKHVKADSGILVPEHSARYILDRDILGAHNVL